ncbi:hypothetical protein QWZ08_10375 [Ferruginibacter paludis]|jgi:hypothetical protein|uniref:hypothetical protein n=1 Tax=Ferruginibacter paludis TaxID=1310417 RepID=UPI0025B5BAFE|nr:hypothetical protein [Ferruginibacter paludis]MDN3656033.1 hypothetical protein [Ferruginibacter paludis]
MASQVDFADIFKQLKTGVVSLAKSTVSTYLNDAKTDGQNLLAEMKDDLERWTKLLISGDLTTKDFEWLVNSEKDSFKMAALENAGLALIRIDQFRNSVLNMIVDTVFKLVKV